MEALCACLRAVGGLFDLVVSCAAAELRLWWLVPLEEETLLG